MLADDLALLLDPVRLAVATGLCPYDWQAGFLRSRGKRQILNCGRQSGKSRVVATKLVHNALAVPGSLALALSPSERQSKLLLEKVYAICRCLGDAVAALDVDNKLYLRLTNTSEIYALPSTEGTVRGFSDVSVLAIDEASRVSDALFYACRPMVAASGGAVILLSTPAGRQGFYFAIWTHGGDTWERTEIPADRVPHLPPAFLAEERAAMPWWIYDQEYCCQFTETDDVVFRGDWIDAAIDPDLAPLFPHGVAHAAYA